MKVRVINGGVVSDGAGGFFAAGVVIDVPDQVADALVRNGHADGDIPERDIEDLDRMDEADRAAFEGADAPDEPTDDTPPPASGSRRRRAS